MSDQQEAVARVKAHGYKLWGFSGCEFLSRDSQRVLSVEEALSEIEKEAGSVQTPQGS